MFLKQESENSAFHLLAYKHKHNVTIRGQEWSIQIMSVCSLGYCSTPLCISPWEAVFFFPSPCTLDQSPPCSVPSRTRSPIQSDQLPLRRASCWMCRVAGPTRNEDRRQSWDAHFPPCIPSAVTLPSGKGCRLLSCWAPSLLRVWWLSCPSFRPWGGDSTPPSRSWACASLGLVP